MHFTHTVYGLCRLLPNTFLHKARKPNSLRMIRYEVPEQVGFKVGPIDHAGLLNERGELQQGLTAELLEEYGYLHKQDAQYETVL